jgi:hypothetical protein
MKNKIMIIASLLVMMLLVGGCESGGDMGVRIDGKVYLIDSGVGRVSVGERVEVMIYEDGSGALVLRRVK